MLFFVVTVTVFWPFTVGVVVLVLWLFEIAMQSSRVVMGIASGARRRDGDMVRCKHGHKTATAGGLYQCQSCNFVYEGSVWLCENPECRAVTPFIDCGTCGISVQSPYRVA